MLVQGFSRVQTVELTGVSIDRLNYLDKTEMITPYRYGSNKRPSLLYSWLQIIQLKLLEAIGKQVSTEIALSSINRIADVISDLSVLKDKDMIVVNSQPYWVERGWSINQLINFIEQDRLNRLKESMTEQEFELLMYKESTATRYVNVGVTYSVKSCVKEIVEAAKNSENIDFKFFKEVTNYDSFKDALELE